MAAVAALAVAIDSASDAAIIASLAGTPSAI